ncbi:bublin coiled-coil protein isoform X2 [Coregonus clupeaformis]|uniref:bublin coiled-coil protein isoform X2 n=1 Tax=Coregonus clupeaformis TaxID=59861 RepID=UPI001BE064B6|nr:bublin coiled-coil protein isoform X2 [Coregonus clupeaformis]
MSGPNGDPNFSIDDGIIDDEDEFSEEGNTAINTMLDQINSCLDDLEERNDSLNDKLHELLESNRQARQEFRVQLRTTTPPGEEQLSPDKYSPTTEGEKGEEGA